MFCTHCGKELLDEDAYCSRCGFPTKEIETKEEPEQGNGMAIAGFVCSFFVPLLGWIFGGIGLSRSFKRNGKGKGLSIAAIAVATAVCIFENLIEYL